MKLRYLILVAPLALVLSACGTSSSVDNNSTAAHNHSSTNGAAVGGGTFLDQKIPENILSAPLFDSEGKALTLNSFAGKYLVIANFLTSCHEICPMTTANLRDIGDAISASLLNDQVVVMGLSVDSQRDIPSRLAAYKAFYESNSFTLASGSKRSLAEVWEYFGAPGKVMEFSKEEQKTIPVDWQTGKQDTYDVMHPDLVLIVSPDSKWRWLDLGAPKTKGNVPAQLKAYLSEEGQKNLAQPEEPTWSVKAVVSALEDLTGKKIS